MQQVKQEAEQALQLPAVLLFLDPFSSGMAGGDTSCKSVTLASAPQPCQAQVPPGSVCIMPLGFFCTNCHLEPCCNTSGLAAGDTSCRSVTLVSPPHACPSSSAPSLTPPTSVRACCVLGLLPSSQYRCKSRNDSQADTNPIELIVDQPKLNQRVTRIHQRVFCGDIPPPWPCRHVDSGPAYGRHLYTHLHSALTLGKYRPGESS